MPQRGELKFKNLPAETTVNITPRGQARIAIMLGGSPAQTLRLELPAIPCEVEIHDRQGANWAAQVTVMAHAQINVPFKLLK